MIALSRGSRPAMGYGKEREVSSEKNQIRSAIEEMENLPTIPKLGMKIIQLATDPDVTMEQLSDVIHQDPSLAARILKIANSPFYGVSRKVDSLQLALVLLGLNEVRNIALGITFFSVMKSLEPKLSHYREMFWYHCASCGIVARILGRTLKVKSEGRDFLAGLLHDLGKIVIDACFGGKFVSTFNNTFKHKPPMLEAEREILGETHEKFGRLLAEKWCLPKSICDAIDYHHEFPSTGSLDTLEDPQTVSLSYLSEAFCEQFEIGWDGDFDCSDLRNGKAWELLLSGQDTYTTDDIDTIIAETLQAFRKSQPHLLWD